VHSSQYTVAERSHKAIAASRASDLHHLTDWLTPVSITMHWIPAFEIDVSLVPSHHCQQRPPPALDWLQGPLRRQPVNRQVHFAAEHPQGGHRPVRPGPGPAVKSEIAPRDVTNIKYPAASYHVPLGVRDVTVKLTAAPPVLGGG
jgi:hypothetical protein